jgi:hypothetical protein
MIYTTMFTILPFTIMIFFGALFSSHLVATGCSRTFCSASPEGSSKGSSSLNRIFPLTSYRIFEFTFNSNIFHRVPAVLHQIHCPMPRLSHNSSEICGAKGERRMTIFPDFLFYCISVHSMHSGIS